MRRPAPVVGLTGPDCTLALYRLASAGSTLWAVEHHGSRCHVLGLGVPSLADTVSALRAGHVRTVRRTDSAIVVDPSQTGKVLLVLVQELFPGDPRR